MRKLNKLKALIRFLLFKEDRPVHRVIENLSPLHAVLVFYFCLFAGSFGFLVLACANFWGFITYYVTVAVMLLEVLHYFYDR